MPLFAQAFDPESPALDFEWSCGNGTDATPQQAVQCTYTAPGSYAAVVAVQDRCNVAWSRPTT